MNVDPASEIDERLARSAEADRFAGAVLVATGDDVVLSRAYGLADRDARTENTVDTRFRIGSLGKMFTATTVLALEAAGQLELEAPLAAYLPEYPTPFARSVTLHDLLTHRAGAGDIFGPAFDAHRQALKEPADYVRLFGAREWDSSSAGQFAYSNYGYVLLGAVIETISGRSYHDHVRDSLFLPLGMTATESPTESAGLAGTAIGYMRTAAGLVSNSSTLPTRATPAGGGLSTVGDLFRFARALQQGTLLGPDLIDELTRGRVPMSTGVRYGYGFIEWEQHGRRTVGNLGSAPGMSAAFQLSLDNQAGVVVVLSNRDPPTAQTVQKLTASLLGW